MNVQEYLRQHPFDALIGSLQRLMDHSIGEWKEAYDICVSQPLGNPIEVKWMTFQDPDMEEPETQLVTANMPHSLIETICGRPLSVADGIGVSDEQVCALLLREIVSLRHEDCVSTKRTDYYISKAKRCTHIIGELHLDDSATLQLTDENLAYLYQADHINRYIRCSHTKDRTKRMEYLKDLICRYDADFDYEPYDHLVLSLRTSSEYPLLMEEIQVLQEIAAFLQGRADEDVSVLWDTGRDDRLGEKAELYMVFSGSNTKNKTARRRCRQD